MRAGERGSAASPAEWALAAYPENLRLGDLAYFLAAPTLSYQVGRVLLYCCTALTRVPAPARRQLLVVSPGSSKSHVPESIHVSRMFCCRYRLVSLCHGPASADETTVSSLTHPIIHTRTIYTTGMDRTTHMTIDVACTQTKPPPNIPHPPITHQVNYPRTSHVRKKWLARRLAELVVCLTLLSLIITQYIEPAVANSMKPLKEV